MDSHSSTAKIIKRNLITFTDCLENLVFIHLSIIVMTMCPIVTCSWYIWYHLTKSLIYRVSNISPILFYNNWLITPCSVSTITALALKCLIGTPTWRFFFYSTFLKNTDKESVKIGLFWNLAYSYRINSQNFNPIWFPHWPT